MVSYLVQTCDSCDSVWDALDRIQHILAKYGKNKYLNDAFLLEKPFQRDRIKLLSRYKDILENCTWDAEHYAPEF